MVGRSDVIQRAFNRANAQSNGANRTVVTGSDLATSLGLQSPEGPKTGQSPVLVANAKGVVKVDPKQMPNLTSGVYVMSRKDGIIKLDSSPGGKIGVKGSPGGAGGVLMVQNRAETVGTVVRKQVLAASQGNSITPVKVVSKPDGSQVVTQMKVISKTVQSKPVRGGILAQKAEPIKIQPKPDPSQMQQIHVVTAVPAPLGLQPRMATTTTIRPNTPATRNPDGRPLLPRPPLRGAAPTSVLGMGATRAPVRAATPRGGLQASGTPRQVLQKRVVASPQSSTSPQNPTINQLRPKTTILSSQTAQPGQKLGVSPVQSKQSPKTTLGKPQSLLSPQQKLLMAKRKAQEAVGLAKAGNRGLLAGARAAQGRGRAGVKAQTASSPANAAANKPKESKLAEGDGLHMEFHEVGSEESSSDGEAEIPPAEGENVAATQPDSPPRPFTLCPLTGRIIGPDGEPMETHAEPEADAAVATTVASAIVQTVLPTVTTSTTLGVQSTEPGSAATELVLPSLDSLTDAAGIMRVEMSPGGTTGTIVQSSETAQISIAAPDLPCLDDTIATSSVAVTCSSGSNVALADTSVSSRSESTAITSSAACTTATSSIVVASVADTVKANEQQQVTPMEIDEKEDNDERRVGNEETSNLVTITGEDGVVYQVAGHAEDGQTLLVTRSGDGDQSCVYVTTEQQGDDGSVLTLDHAVAEAVAQLIPDQVNLAPQFYVKEGENEQADSQMVMSIMDSGATVAGSNEDPDGQAQVVAQVVQADDPTPGKYIGLNMFVYTSIYCIYVRYINCISVYR